MSALMSKRQMVAAILIMIVLVGTGWTYLKRSNTARNMTQATNHFLGQLSEQELDEVQRDFNSPHRLGWHFIPKAERKGLQIRDMDQRQRRSAHALLESALSELGYDKSVKIMKLEAILRALQQDPDSGFVRDRYRYYVTVFGQPSVEGVWGLSIEGHHLSLNFVVDDGRVTSTTPMFMGANPSVVQEDYDFGFSRGDRVLGREEELAFALLGSLTVDQLQVAVVADKAPREIRNAGQPQPPAEPAVGLAASDLNGEQLAVLRSLVEEYLRCMPHDVATHRLGEIHDAGFEHVYFAWAGAQRPGVGHYYRIQGPTFVIELVNTQPDAHGNPASHVHCVWRDPRGDFGLQGALGS